MAGIDKFLVVDGNDSNILFFQMLLERLNRGYTVLSAKTADHAEQLIYDEGVHLVIAANDLKPLMGVMLLQRIRFATKTRRVPFVIYSKPLDEKDQNLIKDLGLAEVLGMPFTKEQATKLIDKLIANEEKLSAIEGKLRKMEDHLLAGDVNEAQALIDPSLTSEGDLWASANCIIARVHIEAKAYDQANALLDSVLAKEPEHKEAARLKAEILSLTQKHDEAIKMLEDESQKSPKNMKVLLKLADAYASANDFPNSENALNKAKALDSGNHAIQDEKGKIAFAKGDFSEAAKLLQNTKAGDELARHFNNLAIQGVQKSGYDEAISIYKHAIEVLVDKAKLYQLKYNLGLAYKKKGALKESFVVFCDSYLEQPTFEKAYAALVKVSKELRTQNVELDAKLVGDVKKAWTTYQQSKPGGAKAS